ncbi:hypothetical protein C0J52_25470 [Blattella germanica]|nr:hypothetical protein C0J52_25470 [Blattella germanica]
MTRGQIGNNKLILGYYPIFGLLLIWWSLVQTLHLPPCKRACNRLAKVLFMTLLMSFRLKLHSGECIDGGIAYLEEECVVAVLIFVSWPWRIGLFTVKAAMDVIERSRVLARHPRTEISTTHQHETFSPFYCDPQTNLRLLKVLDHMKIAPETDGSVLLCSNSTYGAIKPQSD